jgi:hypothetical protein
MANIYRGEVGIIIAKYYYILRPSFQTICTIEGRINKSIRQLIEQIATKGILPTQILAILEIAIIPKIDIQALEQLDLEKARDKVLEFLLNSISSEDMSRLMDLAFNSLNLSPNYFWDLTMNELKIYLNKYKITDYLDRKELDEMMKLCPDL